RAHDPAVGKASLHVRRAGKDTTFNLNAIPGRGVGRDDELRLEYAPDDKYLLMVDTFVGNQAQAPQTGQFLVLRAADNTVAFLPPSGVSANGTMATWAARSDRLYYRDAVGVRTWDAGVTSVGSLVNGLRWYDPAASADGRWRSSAASDVARRAITWRSTMGSTPPWRKYSTSVWLSSRQLTLNRRADPPSGVASTSTR